MSAQPKRLAIVGHRGTGKSTLLGRIEELYRTAGKKIRPFDLDREIEYQTSKSVQQIFQEEGEAVFRRLERETLQRIEAEIRDSQDDVVLVCGAGLNPQSLSNFWQVLWVRRPTDSSGRIFLNRPRLNSLVSPLDEYFERFATREAQYAARADEVLWLDEGVEEIRDFAEVAYFMDAPRNLGGAITLLSEHFGAHLKLWLETRLRWGLDWFELRDDLLTADQFQEALKFLPPEKALLSFRDPSREDQTAGWIDRLGLHYDWPLERGPCPYGSPRFLSLHEREATLEDTFKKFPDQVAAGTQLKAALKLSNFKELELAHRWQSAKPQERVMLPMSDDGRWSWYRLLKSRSYDLNFIRESGGSSTDQPTLLQWIRRSQLKSTAFAAVLGDPVSHSRTPIEHQEYFSAKGSMTYAICLPREEATAEVLGFLRELGLRWAAVTSPLKGFAFEVCSGLSERAETMKSVNTVIFDSKRGVWAGTNTDLDGFETVFKAHAQELGAPIAVWGGGGTLPIVKAVIPDAHFYSMRTGESRGSSAADQTALVESPHAVIWAVGRTPELKMPPASWKPRVVLDLNYADHSPGREYAVSIGAKYISGLTMFHAQAAVQRQFWTEAEKQ